MIETALSMAVILLIGIVFILFRAGWDMHRKIDKLEDFTNVVMEFSREIGGLSREETNKKFDQFIDRKKHEIKRKYHD
jgi:low affinity Fe/Cu permease